MSQTTEPQQWSPRDEKNPFKVWSVKTTEEWKEISRWYEFSVRVLVVLQHSPAQWHEKARCGSWEDAREIMTLLGDANRGKDHLKGYIVMKCSLVSKEGREKPVLWYPSEGSVRAAMKQASDGVSSGAREQNR
jgi:hypothetical protein